MSRDLRSRGVSLAVRREARRFVTEWQRRAVIERWEAFCATGDVSLEEGVLLVSRSEYPAAGEAECLDRLEEYAGVLRRRLATARTADAAFQKLAQFLGGELGFSGTDVDILCPADSYLHRVLERRRGLPILLSVVYLLVARRLDLELVGVSMPRHFVVSPSRRSSSNAAPTRRSVRRGRPAGRRTKRVTSCRTPGRAASPSV